MKSSSDKSKKAAPARRAAAKNQKASKSKTHFPDTWVKPGKPLPFFQEMLKKKLWPVKTNNPNDPNNPNRNSDRKRTTSTPFLYVPAYPGDPGTSRPCPQNQELYSQGISLIDISTNLAVDQAAAGKTYKIITRIVNRGAAGSYGGLCNFYTAPKSVIKNAGATPGSILPAQGYTGFMLLGGKSTIVTSPNTWTPLSQGEAQFTVVAQVFDPFIDNLVHPFNASNDRHVGRRDFIPDFRGIWDGMESANQIHLIPTRIRITVSQSILNVNVAIFGELGAGVFPTSPQDQGTGVISNDIVSLVTTEFIGPSNEPFAQSTWIMTLPNPDVLHFEHYKHYLMPGDTRPDTHTNGDLHRI